MSSRNTYLVAYDIASPKRWRLVYKTMRGFGATLQLSVFRCVLSAVQREMMIAALSEDIHPRADRVLIADLGPVDGRGTRALRFLGRTETFDDDGPFVF